MKRFSFWTVIIVLNAGVLWACVFVFLNLFDVSVYRKEESKFLKEMAVLDLAKQPSGVSGKTETADFDFRKPHPYAGYKPQPNNLELTITNLSPSSRAKLEEKGQRVVINAGYADQVAQIVGHGHSAFRHTATSALVVR